MVTPHLAHALPASVGAFPLTLVLTALIGAFLAINAVGTRQAAGLVGADSPSSTPPASLDANLVTDLLGLLVLVGTVVLSAFGPVDTANNLTDVVVLTIGWGLIALISMAAGPFWHALNPIAATSRLLERLAGPSAPRPLPGQVETGAMVVLLIGWAVAQQLLLPSPTAFAVLVLVYVAGNVMAASVYGPAWLERVEPTGALTSAMGLLSPAGGGPLARLTAVDDTAWLRWMSAGLIGWSVVDLVLETERYHDLGIASSGTWIGVVVLASVIGALYLLITAATSRGRLGPAFVLVAAGWALAQYLSVLLIDAQGIPIWLSDPFGTGADLLGRRGEIINFQPIPVGLQSALQVIPFMAGHIAAVVVAQRRAALRVTRPAQIGPLTLFTRALIAVLLLGGTWMQLGGL